ncbi:MAG: sugar transporter permease [Glaciihabitans sp.]|jgi:multiple sugar transport system permease protein|nr:sugar transporter permease [Glaciihabitans sp.]MDQ1570067.1 multiple sugar transport system permease protein [Actinomycetota bacterium]
MTTSNSGVRRRLRRTSGWGFVAPYLVLLVAFGVAPALYGLYQAFIVTSVVGPSTFSLTQNFSDVLTDYRLPGASLNVLLYLLAWLPALLVIVFGLALAIDAKRTKFAALTRFVTYVPGAVTGAAAALLWLFMFSPQVSPIGGFLRLFTDKSGSFLSDQTFPIVLSVMGIAAGAGGWIVVLYGALTAIPKDVLESATLDGANAWHLVWHIKLPLIRSYVAFILIVSIAQGFQVFVEPTVISAGAPGQVSRTWSINQLVYSYATDNSNYGRAAALAILLLIVCVALAVFIIRKTKFYSIGDR